jgi:hypothetical protein
MGVNQLGKTGSLFAKDCCDCEAQLHKQSTMFKLGFRPRDGTPIMQNLVPVAGIILGLGASAAWAAFLVFEVLRGIGLV